MSQRQIGSISDLSDDEARKLDGLSARHPGWPLLSLMPNSLSSNALISISEPEHLHQDLQSRMGRLLSKK